MIKTRLVSDINLVPSAWILETYVPGVHALMGQDVMVKSCFRKESHPSMAVYCKSGEYRFKDFGGDNSGDAVGFVMQYFKLTYRQAIDKIIEEYNQYNLTHGRVNITLKEYAKYRVTEYHKRKWNTSDQKYWTTYEIGSEDLERFGVTPLRGYRMTKTEDGYSTQMNVTGECLYGYFTKADILYKIYHPLLRSRKAIKVSNYVQGWDQLKFTSDILWITKALKDCINLTKMGWEAIAPDSENTMLKTEDIKFLKTKYSQIILIFDNDEPGIKFAEKYKEKYGFPFITLPEKDPSDTVKKYGEVETKKIIQSLCKPISVSTTAVREVLG